MCFYHISFPAIGNQDMSKNNVILSFTFNGTFNINNLSKNIEQFRNQFQSDWEYIHSCQQYSNFFLYKTYMEMVLVAYTSDFPS